jgi:hypothetical protein
MSAVEGPIEQQESVFEDDLKPSFEDLKTAVERAADHYELTAKQAEAMNLQQIILDTNCEAAHSINSIQMKRIGKAELEGCASEIENVSEQLNNVPDLFVDSDGQLHLDDEYEAEMLQLDQFKKQVEELGNQLASVDNEMAVMKKNAGVALDNATIEAEANFNRVAQLQTGLINSTWGDLVGLKNVVQLGGDDDQFHRVLENVQLSVKAMDQQEAIGEELKQVERALAQLNDQDAKLTEELNQVEGEATADELSFAGQRKQLEQEWEEQRRKVGEVSQSRLLAFITWIEQFVRFISMPFGSF